MIWQTSYTENDRCTKCNEVLWESEYEVCSKCSPQKMNKEMELQAEYIKVFRAEGVNSEKAKSLLKEIKKPRKMTKEQIEDLNSSK